MPSIHPNYIKASNLCFIFLAVGLVNFLLVVAPQLSVGHAILTLVMMITIMGGMAYLLRKGTGWVKYVFLAMFILTHINPTEWANTFEGGAIRIIATITVIALSVSILWLLFTIPKNTVGDDEPKPIS